MDKDVNFESQLVANFGAVERRRGSMTVFAEMETKFEEVLDRHNQMLQASTSGAARDPEKVAENKYRQAALDIEILLQEADDNGGRFPDSTKALVA